MLIVSPLHLLSQVEHILRELEEEHRQSILARLAAMGRDVPPGVDPLDLSQDPDLLSEDDSSDAGSDSSKSDGPPVHLLATNLHHVVASYCMKACKHSYTDLTSMGLAM